MTSFTEQETEQIILMIEFMERKVEGYQTALEKDILPLDLKSNQEMYNNFVKALSQFNSTASKLKENRFDDLTEEEWKLFNLLGIAVTGDCQSLGGPLATIGESIAYTFLKVLTPKWSERQIISSDSNEIIDMFNIIDENDITPFLEKNEQYGYPELYQRGKNKMINNQIAGLAKEEKKVIFEASIYTIRYLKDCVKHNISSMEKDLEKMNDYYEKYLKAFKQYLY